MEFKVIKADKTRAGNLIGELQSLNLTKKFQIFADNVTPEHQRDFMVGAKIDITTSSEWNGFLIPKKYTVLEPAKIGISNEELSDYYEKMREFLSLNSCPELDSVLSLVTTHEGEFKLAPAAVGHHHNYIGGLVVHTLEMLETAESLMNTLWQGESINKELVYAGILLHDFAKIWEYKFDVNTGVIEYNEEFKKEWGNHTLWSWHWAKSNGFNELANIVGRHMGLPEWGAMAKPETPEENLVHICDMASSRLGRVKI